MSKKLMLLAAGALTALAFAALPAVSSAGEFEAHCSVEPCIAEVTGGLAVLQDDSGGNSGKIECTSVTGEAELDNTTPTGAAVLLFHGCKDGAFGSSCKSAGQPAGTIETNEMVSHLVYIDATPAQLVGILLTGANVTFECFGGFVKKTVTGNIIGKIENPECGKARTHHTIEFAVVGGSQQYKQVTTTSTMFDLTSGSHSSDTTTSSQTGTGHLTYEEGTVTLTC